MKKLRSTLDNDLQKRFCFENRSDFLAWKVQKMGRGIFVNVFRRYYAELIKHTLIFHFPNGLNWNNRSCGLNGFCKRLTLTILSPKMVMLF